MILSIYSSLGYVPHSYQQYPQNPSQFPPGPTHHSYPHQGYPPPESGQYMYYGQPAPSTQLPPAGGSVHQYTGVPMQRPNYQGSKQCILYNCSSNRSAALPLLICWFSATLWLANCFSTATQSYIAAPQFDLRDYIYTEKHNTCSK